MGDTIPTGADRVRANRLVDGPLALFVYGTLQFEAVLTGLVGRIPDHRPATAPGWRAAALDARVYPGLVPAPASEAHGLLLTGMSEREWRILDTFEDDQYDLRRLDLACGSAAWAYVWQGGDVRAEDWDARDFQDRHLQDYAARCARIAPALEAKASTGRG
ncbi:gamma-glutamylcyclotransferase family protein [Streptomyces sp. NPDC059575]|uniref:gamma-glutamylcyclotransferase family protein n=1 Tax=Streptomyces sp. NPDC059575 TaxID=3346872 RepID=UPI00368C174A